MFDYVFKRGGLKKPKRPLIESSCGGDHITFFQRG